MLSPLKEGVGAHSAAAGGTHTVIIHSFMSTEELGASFYRGGSLAFRFPSGFPAWELPSGLFLSSFCASQAPALASVAPRVCWSSGVL